MKKIILSYLFLVTSLLAIVSTANAYCEQGHPNYQGQEIFKWVQSGRWPLYAWTRKPFDSGLPTVIFFNGGPGQSSHGVEWEIPGWNLIFWDQRGVGCSKPLSVSAYQDVGAYSIQGTADDAVAVLKAFGVKKASLYAVSYGTAPATVLASQHPQLVNALVLEGTLVTGTEQLHNAKFRQNILKRYYEKLDVEMKSTLAVWSQDPLLHRAWFSRLGFYFMGHNQGLEKLTGFFTAIKNSGAFSAEFFNNFGPRAFEDEELGFSAQTYKAIACQELSQGSVLTHGGLQLLNGHLEEIEDLPAQALCQGVLAKQSYDALKYPVKVPVVYFQGVHDGATSGDQAILHFKKVAKGPRIMNLLKTGGHTPLSADLFDPFSEDQNLKSAYMEQLKSALKGQSIPWDKSFSNWKQIRK